MPRLPGTPESFTKQRMGVAPAGLRIFLHPTASKRPVGA